MAQSTQECQKLLLALKVTAEALLLNKTDNVSGNLNQLHLALEKIFAHGRRPTDEGITDCQSFIKELSESESLLINSTSSQDVNVNQDVRVSANFKGEETHFWISKLLQQKVFSKHLDALLTNSKLLNACYEEYAFFRQYKFLKAAILCLKAIEQNRIFYLEKIDSSLYITDLKHVKSHKTHKRCSSLPEAKLLINGEQKNLAANDTFSDVSSVKNDSTSELFYEKCRVEEKTKLYDSLPNLEPESFSKDSNTVHLPENKLPENILEVDYGVDSGRRCDTAPQCTKLKNRKKFSFHETGREWFVIQGKKEERKKTFMEDGGTSVLPMSTGYFPRPVQGQSLTSFLSSEHFSRTVAELDRENAHFSISEAMISAIEQMKCNRQLRLVEDVNDDDSDEEINQLKQRIRLRRRQRLEEKHLKHLWSASLLSDGKTDTTTDQSVSPFSTSSESSSGGISTDDVDDLEVGEENSLSNLKNSTLSVSMASLYSEADVSKVKKEGSEGANAENVALSLLKQFKKKQLPKASDLEWLVSEEDAPQELLPLPKSWPVSPDDAERINTPFLRGTTDWAPPRPQVIFTQHPAPVRRLLLTKQNFRCAGCGLRVAPEYAHKFRYCEYLGRYFCTGCHSNQLSLIPGHILFRWSFKRFPVSTFSYKLLDQMSTDPLFPIKDINADLYKKVKVLERTRLLRMQLFYLKDFLFNCRFAQPIQEDLEKEPSHMFQEPEMYSLQDLAQVKTGELTSRLKDLVKDCLLHVQNCQLCSARGFVCELCPSKEAIFPWFIDKVSRCSQCGACFHFQCFKSGFCPRCARATARRQSAIDGDF